MSFPSSCPSPNRPRICSPNSRKPGEHREREYEARPGAERRDRLRLPHFARVIVLADHRGHNQRDGEHEEGQQSRRPEGVEIDARGGGRDQQAHEDDVDIERRTIQYCAEEERPARPALLGPIAAEARRSRGNLVICVNARGPPAAPAPAPSRAAVSNSASAPAGVTPAYQRREDEQRHADTPENVARCQRRPHRPLGPQDRTPVLRERQR